MHSSATAPLNPGEIRQHHSLDGYEFRVFATPQAGHLVQTRRDGATVRDMCSQHNDETTALRFYAELVAMHPAPMTDGEQLTCVAGNAEVSLTHTGRTYAITTIVGTKRVDEWSFAYPDELTARAEARRTARALRTHGTDLAVTDRRDQLDRQLRVLLHRGGPQAELQRRAICAELTDLETLADAATMRRLADDLDYRNAA